MFLDIVSLVDWYVFDNYFIIVMEYLDGFEDMSKYLEKYGCIKEKAAKKLFKKVCNIYVTNKFMHFIVK